MILNWFKIFFRNSKKNWLNLTVNILGLTLGIGVLLISLLYLKDEKSYNSTNPEANKIYRAIHKLNDSNEYWETSCDLEGKFYVQELPEVEDYFLSETGYASSLIKHENKEIYVDGILIGSQNFFEFFPFPIVEGSYDTYKQARNHIAISEEKAKLFFGEQSAIGKTLKFSDRSFVVTTVFKIEGKHFYMPNMVIPYKKKPNKSWGNFHRYLLIKTNQNIISPEFDKKVSSIWYHHGATAIGKLMGISADEVVEKFGEIETVFEPLSEVRLKTKSLNAGPEGKGNYQLILILLALSILLLVISSVNVINLSIASATQRAKEVGVKKTLGLSKIQIVLTYCFEVLVQGLIALILAILCVELILPLFNNFMGKNISILDINALSKITLITIILSLVIGIIPAIYLANFKPTLVLKGNISRGKQGVFARKIMLGLQFLISGFFLVGSLIINKQINHMIDKDLGFNGNQVLMINMYNKKNKYQKYQLAKKELVKHQNIKAVTSNSFTIGGGNNDTSSFEFNNMTFQADINAIEYNYFDVLNIKLKEGRLLNPKIASDSIKNVVVNEALTKRLNIYNNPIGKIINSSVGSKGNEEGKLHIVGVVKDHHVKGLDSSISPMIYQHWNSIENKKNSISDIQIKVSSTNLQETLAYIEDYWNKNIETGYPFEAEFINERFAKTFKEYKKQQTLFLIVTSIVILIALLGLFALATLTIQERLKEVAIKKALGASTKEIITSLIKSFITISLIASVCLIPLAYYLAQNWLNNFIFRIDMPVLPYIIAPITLIILVIAVVGIKAFNATKVDLIKYLKYE